MLVNEFVKAFAEKKIVNTKINEHAVSDYLKKELEIKSYIPFRDKRKIAEMIVAQNIEEVDGIKRYDSINGYVSLVVASIKAHTNLEWSADPVADYDLLAESKLLPQIIAEFQDSHNEIDIIRKMALEMELEDNNVKALIGRFLNKISGVLDDVVNIAKDKFENFNPKDVFGVDIKEEDLAKFIGLLDKLK